MPGFSLAENVIRNRFHPFIKELAPYCSKITIVSPGSSHHKLKISNPKIKYITVKNEKKSSNFMWRFIQEIQISRKIWKAAKAENPDVLIASIPSMALLFQAQKLAKLQVLDIRDLTWEYLTKTIFQRACKSIMIRIAIKKLNRFNLFICTNQYEKKLLLLKYKCAKNKLLCIENGVSQSMFKKLVKKPKQKRNPNIIISYVGNIGIAQNLKTLVNAAREFPDVRFNIVGDGIERLALEREASNNVRFLGNIDQNRLISIYQASNILYGQISKEYLSAVPSKIYEYLATGRVIVFGCLGACKALLSGFSHHKIISPDNMPELKSAIKTIISKKQYLRTSTYNQNKIKKLYIREKKIRCLTPWLLKQINLHIINA